MTDQQIKAVVRACSAALALEKGSTLAFAPQRTLSIVAVCQFLVEASTPPKADGSGGWGTSKLGQPPINNPFGIQYAQRLEDYGSFDEPSWEIEHGIRVDQVETFQKFPDLATAFAEHQRLLLMKAPVRAALPGGWIAVCVALGPPIDAEHCGYSTNPAYPKVLTSIGSELGLDRRGWFEWYAAGADAATKPA